MAFCRIDDRPCGYASRHAAHDALVIQDATRLHQVNVLDGPRSEGAVLVDSPDRVEELGLADRTASMPHAVALTVPATVLALRHFGRPVRNAVRPAGLAAGGYAVLGAASP
ncbi:hypothetical protein [Streptomyces sp. NPDC059224]|uniref:hypothetical protein n=1 Tax=Streptomyces sp. NPDC059224 TaxID=3346775 RepID=UPI00368B16FD